MATDAAGEFATVPATARLEDCPPGSLLHQAATALYDEYRLSNIGPAKRSKLLHSNDPGWYRSSTPASPPPIMTGPAPGQTNSA
jgi:hypothetical protein